MSSAMRRGSLYMSKVMVTTLSEMSAAFSWTAEVILPSGLAVLSQVELHGSGNLIHCLNLCWAACTAH